MAETFITWPAWMPAPQQDSFSIQPEDRRLISETEVGSIIRRQFDADVNVAECTLILSRPQAAWLEVFERGILRQGTVWFDFPLWIGGEIVREKCRFKTRPKAGNLIGLYTTYTFSLYVSKRSHIAFDFDCLMELLACWPPCFFFNLNYWMQQFLSTAKNYKLNINVRLDAVFEHLFTTLSHVTEDGVNDALSGLEA